MIERNIYSAEQKAVFWGDGQWCIEPDEMEFEHAGYNCFIRRVSCPDGPDKHMFGGHLCGYVEVLPSHPYYDKGTMDLPLDVHGGITYSDHCEFLNGRYVIGFDCAHCGDLMPSMKVLREQIPELKAIYDTWPGKRMFLRDTYKDINFVIKQCKELAEQIANPKELTNEEGT